jgi:DNA-binding MarR family transcriptional regulator
MGEGIFMPAENARDPRTTLYLDKAFASIPQLLRRYLWRSGMPPSAERVYWVLWEEGARSKTWCARLTLRQLARECCIDESSVTRALRYLADRQLIVRPEAPRDPVTPWLQQTPVTEVRVPREVLVEMAREPNRRPRLAAVAAVPAPAPRAASAPPPAVEPFSRDDHRAAIAKLSEAERQALTRAMRDRSVTLAFDADTRLSPTERACVLWGLEVSARTPARAAAPPAAARPPGPQRLAVPDIIRLQTRLRTLAVAAGRPFNDRQLWEVVYSIEEGQLAKFESGLALNTAVKKVREGQWSTPRGMPVDWASRRGARDVQPA